MYKFHFKPNFSKIKLLKAFRDHYPFMGLRKAKELIDELVDTQTIDVEYQQTIIKLTDFIEKYEFIKDNKDNIDLLETECGLILEVEKTHTDTVPSEYYCLCSDIDCRGEFFIAKEDIDIITNYIPINQQQKLRYTFLKDILTSINLLKKTLFKFDDFSLLHIDNIERMLNNILNNLNRGNTKNVLKDYDSLLGYLRVISNNEKTHDFFIDLLSFLSD